MYYTENLHRTMCIYGELQIAKWFPSLWWTRAFLCFLPENLALVFGIGLACSIILSSGMHVV